MYVLTRVCVCDSTYHFPFLVFFKSLPALHPRFHSPNIATPAGSYTHHSIHDTFPNNASNEQHCNQ